MDLNIPIKKFPRNVHFNFRYENGQKDFYKMTQNFKSLLTCFQNQNQPFQTQVKKWEKCLKGYFHQTFQKVRPKKKKFTEDDVGPMLDKRKRMKMEKANTEELEEIELEIASKIENKHLETVNEHIGHVTGEDGNINTHGIWQTKIKISPKQKQQVPLAIKDKKGKLITGKRNKRPPIYCQCSIT